MLKRRTKKWFHAVMFIVVIVALAIVASVALPQLKTFRTNMKATQLLAVVNQNNPIPTKMWGLTVATKDVAIWALTDPTFSWDEMDVTYNSDDAANLNNAVVNGDPIMTIAVNKNKIKQTDSSWNIVDVDTADFKVWDTSDWDADNIKGLFETNRKNNNTLTIKKLYISWTKKMTYTEAGDYIIKVWTAKFTNNKDSSNPVVHSYADNYTLKY